MGREPNPSDEAIRKFTQPVEVDPNWVVPPPSIRPDLRPKPTKAARRDRREKEKRKGTPRANLKAAGEKTKWKPGQSGNPTGRPVEYRDFVRTCRSRTNLSLARIYEALQLPMSKGTTRSEEHTSELQSLRH